MSAADVVDEELTQRLSPKITDNRLLYRRPGNCQFSLMAQYEAVV